jgi:hypothetical protein
MHPNQFPLIQSLPLELLIGFLLGVLFSFFYYKNLWCYAKIKGREYKIAAIYGKNSSQLKRFKRKFRTFRCNTFFRLLVAILFSLVVYTFTGHYGLGGAVLGILSANLTLFGWGIYKTSHNSTKERREN